MPFSASKMIRLLAFSLYSELSRRPFLIPFLQVPNQILAKLARHDARVFVESLVKIADLEEEDHSGITAFNFQVLAAKRSSHKWEIITNQLWTSCQDVPDQNFIARVKTDGDSPLVPRAQQKLRRNCLTKMFDSETSITQAKDIFSNISYSLFIGQRINLIQDFRIGIASIRHIGVIRPAS